MFHLTKIHHNLQDNIAELHSEAIFNYQRSSYELVYAFDGSYDNTIAALHSIGCIVASPKFVGLGRIFTDDPKHHVSEEFSYVALKGLFVPKSHDKNHDKKIILLDDDALTIDYTLAVLDHDLDKEHIPYNFHQDNFHIDEFLENLSKEKYCIVKNKGPFDTTNLADYEEMVFVYKDATKKYGKFLYKSGIRQTGFYLPDDDYIDSQSGPFVNQFLLSAIFHSYLNINKFLHTYCSVRGVRPYPYVEKKP